MPASAMTGWREDPSPSTSSGKVSTVAAGVVTVPPVDVSGVDGTSTVLSGVSAPTGTAGVVAPDAGAVVVPEGAEPPPQAASKPALARTIAACRLRHSNVRDMDFLS
jgi:hypothetical protein